MSTVDILKKLYYEALNAVSPYVLVTEHIDRVKRVYSYGGFRKLYVVAFGKSAVAMAKAAEDGLGDLLCGAIAITKYDHVGTNPLSVFDVYEAGHPLPDENGLNATREVLFKLRNWIDGRTLVVFLISGGGSSLLVSPAGGISLGEKQAVTGALLRSGANIGEFNAVRKHLSAVKGGQLALHCRPATVLSLIISDVIGDDLSVIASGPTAPDATGFSDALSVIEKYGLSGAMPLAVAKYLESGMKGINPETPKPGHPVFENVQNLIIGYNKKALDAIVTWSTLNGMKAGCLTAELSGEARLAAKWLADRAKERLACGGRCILVSGGETTVTVKGSGKGGRNTEFALAFAIETDGIEGITLLSAGSDGSDGETDAAGAIVDGQSVRRGRDVGMNPISYLENNDSYTFFERTDGLFKTGPTGTNVMDFQIVAINPKNGS